MRDRRVQIAAIAIVGVLALCLVAVLLYNILMDNGGTVTEPTPTTTTEAVAEATETEETETDVTPESETETEEEPTATNTPVSEATETMDETEIDTAPSATPEPASNEATPVPDRPTATPLPPTVTSAAASFTVPSLITETVVVTNQVAQVLQNADFEQGFNDDGSAIGWTSFQNANVLAVFAPEVPPYIHSGQAAQRITIVQAIEQNRYAGLQQTVDVVPGETYILTLHGHVRSAVGDIQQSSYGYRIQYGLDYNGGRDWYALSADKWVELPWDETSLYGGDTTFHSYTTTVTARSDRLTLFVRGWNKWADRSEGQYTFDNFSLVGPTHVTEVVTRTILVQAENNPSTGASATSGNGTTSSNGTSGSSDTSDNLLPVTGAIPLGHLAQDGRAWVAVLLLMMLSGSLIYRLRYR